MEAHNTKALDVHKRIHTFLHRNQAESASSLVEESWLYAQITKKRLIRWECFINAMRYCTNCGAQLTDNSLYCPKCGKLLFYNPQAPTGQATTAPPPPQWPAPLQTGFDPQEREAVGRIKWYAIISLASVVISFGMIPFEPSFSVPPNPTSAQVAALINSAFQFLAISLLVGEALAVATYFMLWSGFRKLSRVSYDFSTPSKLTFLLLIAGPIILIALFALVEYLLGVVEPLLAQAGSAPVSPPPSLVSDLLSLFAIIIVLAIVALVGLIGGVILGLWRTGSRYSKDMIKAAAILVIFPYVDIVGYILVLIGTHQIGKEIAGRHAPAL
jgi:Protein of unknown function (DUF973)/zinc-ribbon domain